ncbi:hypothetical protein ACFQ1S_36155, partial [Kibdelosporangium lantanae]
MSDAFENSGVDRAELARKRQKFLADLGSGPAADDNTRKGGPVRRQRPRLTRFTSLAAVTVTVGAA